MNIEVGTVFKWVATIIITGFLAQFGKMLAQYIIKKVKRKKSDLVSNVTIKHSINDKNISKNLKYNNYEYIHSY